MKNTNVLYSANSKIAYKLNKRYYDDKHYVYVADRFGSPEIESSLESNPPSSSPFDRYTSLKAESQRSDKGGYYIQQNKAGIKKGADAKFKNGIITEKECNLIYQICDEVQLIEFSPLMYIIPYEKVKHLLEDVPVNEKAGPLSAEWVIKELPGDLFDIICF
ncbi:MAG: hypothetical protein K8R40_11670 [Anaerolineaceae bacterium]|nr:hypothetical protein [Anaerolineaceae bacterium]